MTAIVGIDIAKKKFDIALFFNNKFKSKVFDNTPVGFAQLLDWLAQQGVTQACFAMEATGVYFEALATSLAAAAQTVFVINPAQVKHYAQSQLTRGKTDKSDARIIAQFVASHRDQLTPWQALPPERRILRDLFRRLEALKDLLHQEANRLESAQQAEVVASIQAVIETLNTQIESVKALIRKHIDDHPDLRKQRDLLESIPGVGGNTCALLLAELPFDNFSCAKAAAAFAGLSPAPYESGSSVRGKSRLSKVGSPSLRKGLYFPAVTASRYNPLLRLFYLRLLANGKTKMAALGAVMRKLVHLAFAILKSGKPFDPDFLQSSQGA